MNPADDNGDIDAVLDGESGCNCFRKVSRDRGDSDKIGFALQNLMRVFLIHDMDRVFLRSQVRCKVAEPERREVCVECLACTL